MSSNSAKWEMAVNSGRFLAPKWEIQKTPSFGGVWLGRPITLPPPISSPKVSHGGTAMGQTGTAAGCFPA
jgi:hypothetical protein